MPASDNYLILVARLVVLDYLVDAESDTLNIQVNDGEVFEFYRQLLRIFDNTSYTGSEDSYFELLGSHGSKLRNLIASLLVFVTENKVMFEVMTEREISSLVNAIMALETYLRNMCSNALNREQ